MNTEPSASVRPSAVAGMFYPGTASELSLYIERALADAAECLPADMGLPKALIVPHAGYIYSGATAAFAYATLKGASIRRVVLLGPAHRVPFYGLALPDSELFATPLGNVRLDIDAMQAVESLPGVSINGLAHAMEHSLEVQLPFLQVTIGDYELLPLCIGSVESGLVARVIEQLWEEADTLFVISSDLSHYHPYETAVALDRRSIDMILGMESGLDHDQACGATGINALLEVAKRRNMQIRLLDYRNSGDTAGDRDHVVGYASMAFFEPGEHR